MKLVCVVSALLIVTFIQSCAPSGRITGRYTNVVAGIAGEELRFVNNPNKFDYYSRTEGVIKSYSSGTWNRNQGTIFLNGYDDRNLNTLNVERKVEHYFSGDRDKIVVQYKGDPLDTITKVQIIVNETIVIPILTDTTFFTDKSINTLRIKSYLNYKGLLLATDPTVDTLYSQELGTDHLNGRKLILLKINVDKNYFYRTTLKDTLTIKNNRTVIWRNREFRRIKTDD